MGTACSIWETESTEKTNHFWDLDRDGIIILILYYGNRPLVCGLGLNMTDPMEGFYCTTMSLHIP